MAKRTKKTIYAPADATRTGIDVSYQPAAKIIEISGWYDGSVGIKGRDISLGDFLRELGITRADVNAQHLEGDPHGI